jgi:hypothetical protein
MLISNYKSFISKFVKNGYKFIFYDELNNSKCNQVILRHDIDLDIDLAYEMAIIENSMGIKSTYFFLLSNNSYNLISDKNKKLLIKIRELGHKISLHFDMMIYDNILEGFRREQEIFNQIFNEKINIISIHRPKKDFLKSPDNFFNISNSYEKEYMNNISYFADSGGSFRYGNPLNSNAFKNNQNIQLVIHPAWWMINGNSVNEIVEDVIENKSEKIRSHFEKSIKTYNPNS